MVFIQDPEGFSQGYTYSGGVSSGGDDDTRLVPPNSIILFIHGCGVAH
jgi:hypothetical protein